LEKKMKNRKWLTYTLGTLLTLAVLAAVAGVSFRIGMTQNASFTRPAFARGFDSAPQGMQRNFQDNGGPQGMQGNPQNNDGTQKMQGNFQDNGWNQMRGDRQYHGFDNSGNNRGGDRRGEPSIFSAIFGLIHLAVLGLIIWGVYTLVKKSGWRLTRVETAPAPIQTASVEEVGKKKTSK
jgi:hypothetical protein